MFDTRAQLQVWLEREGLTHVAKLSLEAVAPLVEPGYWPQLRNLGMRRRLIDLATTEGQRRFAEAVAESPLSERLPSAVAQFIEAQRAETAQARSEADLRRQPPTDSRLRAVFERVMALRARLPPSVAPRLALSLDDLRFDAQLPGFRFTDLLPSEMPLRAGGLFARPVVKVTLSEAHPKTDCSCGETGCVHTLAALDTVGVWLRQPVSGAMLEVVRALQQPPWERALQALDAALAQPAASSTSLDLWWLVRVIDDLGIDVTPHLPTAGPSSKKTPRGPLTRRRLQTEFAANLSNEDARLVALLPEGDSLASRALLDALVDHPRLVLESDPEKTVRIERAPLGLVADDRGGLVQVGVGLEGAVLPPALADKVQRSRPADVLFLWDEGPRRLTLLDVKPELRAVLTVLQKEGSLFPPESHASLLDSLSRWAQRFPVAMPRSVLGEAVPPAIDLVLRLEAHAQGAVVVQVRVRPLEGAGALVPGHGARDVHVRRGEKAVHAVRNFSAELAAAQAFSGRLVLDDAEELPTPFSWQFADPRQALELVTACEAMSPAPELEWVGNPVRTLGAKGPGSLRVVLEQRREWFGVLGELNVMGERVELARLLDAARRKEKYVEVRPSTYVELSHELRRHLEKLTAHVHVTNHGLELGPSAAEALRQLQGDGALVDADVAWQALAARVRAAQALKVKPPTGLKATLRPYQAEGVSWLLRLAAWQAGGVLADDMGLGKTVQALAVLLARKKLGPALVVAPTSVAFNWVDEAKRFAPSLKVVLLGELVDRAEGLSRLKAGDVLVVSYGLLVRDAAALQAVRFATAVFDEAQHLKNATTQRTRAARGLQAEARFALSGTPLENHLGELWSLFAVVFPGLLGSWERFRDRFAGPIEKGTDPTAMPALAEVLSPFLLRRTKARVEAELPARTEVKVSVVLSAAEWQLYEDTRLAALSELETRKSVLKEQERRVEVLAALTRLRLMASHPKLADPTSELPSSKLARCLELIDELASEGQRVLVFSQFTSHLALVREALVARGLGCLNLDGQTPAKARRALVAEFQTGTVPVFLISLKAGGFGLNLTAATNVIHLDPWWNPAAEDQASDRAHRLGQTKPVTIYRLVAKGTIEEQMLSLHESKRALVSQVLAGTEHAAKLSTNDLLALLSRGLHTVRLAGDGQ